MEPAGQELDHGAPILVDHEFRAGEAAVPDATGVGTVDRRQAVGPEAQALSALKPVGGERGDDALRTPSSTRATSLGGPEPQRPWSVPQRLREAQGSLTGDHGAEDA